MVDLVKIIVPTAVCCVMPVLIVLIVARMKVKKTEFLMNTIQKAIENGADIDPDKILFTDKDKFMKQELIRQLDLLPQPASVSGDNRVEQDIDIRLEKLNVARSALSRRIRISAFSLGVISVSSASLLAMAVLLML